MFVRLLSFRHCWFYPTVSLSFDDPRVCLVPSCFQLLTVFRVVTLPSINLFHFCFFRINISSFYLIYFPSFHFTFVLSLLLYLACLPFLFCFDRNLSIFNLLQKFCRQAYRLRRSSKLLKARFLCSEVVNADTLTLFRRRVPKSCCLVLFFSFLDCSHYRDLMCSNSNIHRRPVCNTLHRYVDELHAELLIVRRPSTALCDCIGSGSSLVKCISTGSVSRYNSLILIVDFGITSPFSITVLSCSKINPVLWILLSKLENL